MIKKLDHIGIAVDSIDAALAVYQTLGLVESHREDVPSQRVRTAFVPAGETQLELLEPLGADSPISKFLARRGPGIHHLCFEVDDIRRTIEDLRAKGYRLLDAEPVPGAGGKLVAFLHPESGRGVLIELSQNGN